MNEKKKKQKSPLQNGTVFPKDNETEKISKESRLQRLSPFRISVTGWFSTFRIADYCDEAERSFIEGCFRSCIICSATAVELALKHTLILLSEDWEKRYWEIELGKIGFYKVVKELRELNNELGGSLDEALWLRRARNEVVAHPIYISNPFAIKKAGTLDYLEPERQIWACKIMQRDISKLLQFVEPNKRKEIEEKKFSTKDGQSRILREFSVMDCIKQLKPNRYEPIEFLYWRVIQNELMEEIAFQAYKRLANIMNSLFPSKI